MLSVITMAVHLSVRMKKSSLIVRGLMILLRGPMIWLAAQLQLAIETSAINRKSLV